MVGLRFLVISDVHLRENVKHWVGRSVKEHGADGVIVLGDITHFGPGQWAGEFLSSLPGKVIAVPGNCDPPLALPEIERSSLCLHGKRVKMGDRDFIGYGGSNPTMFNTPNEMPEEHIYRELSALMVPGAVLVLHCPPYGINDLTRSGHRGGSLAIKKVVEESRPVLVLAGHIHEARGIVEQDGTLFVNPGAAKDGFSALLDIDGDIEAELLDQIVD